MRCICCNTALNNYEATIRHGITKQFLEMCSTCLKSVDAYIPTQVRQDLISENDTGNCEMLDDNGEYLNDCDDDNYDDYWEDR